MRDLPRPVVAATLAAALGGFFFGYDTGIISSVLLFARDEFALGPLAQGVLVSVVPVGGVVGAVLAGRLARRHGRRGLMQGSAWLFLAGTVAGALAPSAASLVATRFVAGLALGLLATIAPVYVAELAPPAVRGRLVGCFQLAIVVGIVVAGVAGLGLAGAEAWRWMLVGSVPPALALALVARRLVESPRWLLAARRTDEAGNVLAMLGDPSWVEREVAEIDAALRADESGARSLRTPVARRAVLVGVGIAALQQLIGINAVIYFAPSIVELSGVRSASAAILAGLGIAAVNLAATVAAMPLLDRTGRRRLLLAGVVTMEVALLGLALAFSVAAGTPAGTVLAIGSLMLYVGAFAASLGPVVWLINSEVYPPGLRSTGAALATIANRVCSFVVSLTFLPLVALTSPAGAFGAFGAVGLATLLFCWRLVPETSGVRLERAPALLQAPPRHGAITPAPPGGAP